MKESDIVYERGDYWVSREDVGYYKIWRTGATCSTRVGTVCYSDDDAKAINKAIAECNRRADMN